MRHDRTVIGYHGCDAATAERILAGEAFKPSVNDYDWLGHGIYFWEYGADRAMRFARNQQGRGKVKTPAVVGAVIQLGSCFDLFDTRYTADLADAYTLARAVYGTRLPKNAGNTRDLVLRRRDCAVLNVFLHVIKQDGVIYDAVRCGFTEGKPAFPGSGIRTETHIQLAVRNPSCILGVFRPTMEKP